MGQIGKLWRIGDPPRAADDSHPQSTAIATSEWKAVTEGVKHRGVLEFGFDRNRFRRVPGKAILHQTAADFFGGHDSRLLR